MLMIFLAIMGLLGVGVILVVIGTLLRNRWGINIDPVRCPRCNLQLPKIRTPKNSRQALWGGSICGACGTEVDKWGRELSRPLR